MIQPPILFPIFCHFYPDLIQHGLKYAGMSFCGILFHYSNNYSLLASLFSLRFLHRYRHLTVQSFTIYPRFSYLLMYNISNFLITIIIIRSPKGCQFRRTIMIMHHGPSSLHQVSTPHSSAPHWHLLLPCMPGFRPFPDVDYFGLKVFLPCTTDVACKAC